MNTRLPIGTNYYTQSDINDNVYIKFCNENGFADDAQLRNTAVLPTEAGIFAVNASLKVVLTGDVYINIAAEDGDAPVWKQTSGEGSNLLGEIVVDFNPTNAPRVLYGSFVGFPFQVNDVLTGDTSGATADIDANTPDAEHPTEGELVLSNVVGGPFTNGEQVDGTIGQLQHGTIVGGPFQNGETITGSISGATAVVLSDATGALTYDTLAVAQFQAGENITGGTSGAVAPVTSNLNPGSAQALVYAFLSDQEIEIQDGFRYIITDAQFSEPTAAITTADDLQVWTAPGRTGVQLLVTGQALLGFLVNSFDAFTLANEIAKAGGSTVTDDINVDRMTFETPKLYLSIGTPEGSAAESKFGIYGARVA